jgi:peroxiredoxin
MIDHVALGQLAPDFELTDVAGRAVRLSDYRGSKNVVLVFTRGFL